MCPPPSPIWSNQKVVKISFRGDVHCLLYLNIKNWLCIFHRCLIALRFIKISVWKFTPQRGWFFFFISAQYFLFYDKRLFSKIMKRRYSVKDSKCIKCIKYLLWRLHGIKDEPIHTKRFHYNAHFLCSYTGNTWSIIKLFKILQNVALYANN